MSINTNFPVVGKNQPSQSFRDNFTDIDSQFTQIRSKQIRFESGDLTGTSQIIGSGAGEILFTAQIRDNPELSGAESMLIPQGITAQRPNVPQRGHLRFNQTIVAFEGYNGNTWVALSGAGGVVQVEDEGIDLGIGSVSVLNFVGPGVIATSAGGGTVDINVTSGVGGSTVLFVNDIAGRDALSTTGGELVLVVNDSLTADGVPGEGEWAFFLRNQTDTAWFEVGTEQRGDEEVESISIDFQHDSGALLNIGVVPAGRRVVKVTVKVLTAFNGTLPTLQVGSVATANLLMNVNENDLEGVFIYEVNPGLGAFGTNTGVRATYSANGATTGAGRITIAYA